MPHTNPTYSPRDVSHRWVCKVDTVLRAIAMGKLKAINVGLGTRKPRWRITQEALDAFEAARSNSPAMPKAMRRRRKADPAVTEYF